PVPRRGGPGRRAQSKEPRVVAARQGCLQARVRIGSEIHVVALGAETARHELQDAVLVVDDQNPPRPGFGPTRPGLHTLTIAAGKWEQYPPRRAAPHLARA